MHQRIAYETINPVLLSKRVQSHHQYHHFHHRCFLFSLLSFSIDAFRTHRRHPHYLRQATERHDLPAREQLHFRHRFQPRIQLRGLSAEPRQIHARPDRAALLPPAGSNLERRARLSLTKQLGFVQCIASIP